MNKLTRWTGCFLLALYMTGCVPSLHPLYTDADLVFNLSLLGVWSKDKDTKETWTFNTQDEQSYNLVFTDNEGKTGEFSAHLLKVKDTLFLDLYPAEAKLTQNDFYKMHLVRAHTFMWVKQIQPTLQMTCLDADWTKKFLETNPTAVRHEKTEDNGIVLTAAPKELQAFLLANLNTKGAFGEPMNLTHKNKTP